jgi:hypothetical protein
MNDQSPIIKVIGVSSLNITAFIVSFLESVEPALRVIGLIATIAYTSILIYKALRK